MLARGERPPTSFMDWWGGAMDADNKPNILLITTDQQHFRLMSCAGDPYVKTPNLDRLAADGVRFDLAYSPNPVCVPCRYSWMTGRMPSTFNGLETNLKGGGGRPKIRDCIETPCMGTLLRSAGYETVCGGKLHVEGGYSFTPDDDTSTSSLRVRRTSRAGRTFASSSATARLRSASETPAGVL